METDARERLRRAVEAVVVKHGYFDNAELVEAARALLGEPPAGDAAQLAQLRDRANAKPDDPYFERCAHCGHKTYFTEMPQ